MDVPLAVLADTALISADGKLSVIGIFGAIRSAEFPTTHPQCALVIQFRASPGERGQHKAVLIRLMDDDHVLLELNAEFQVPEQSEGPIQAFLISQILQIQSLRLLHPGSYSFYILVNGEEKAQVAFQASLMTSPSN